MHTSITDVSPPPPSIIISARMEMAARVISISCYFPMPCPYLQGTERQTDTRCSECPRRGFQYAINTHILHNYYYYFNSTMSSISNHVSGESFADFFGKWMFGLEQYLPRLTEASKDPLPQEAHLRDLVRELTVHHKQYYDEKWADAEARGRGDVFVFFAMPWMTSLERAYSWMTGWKPSLAFRIVEALREGEGASFSGAFRELSEEQEGGINRLREMIRMEEERVEKDMERQQVGLGGMKMAELVCIASRVKEGDEEGSNEVWKQAEEAIGELGVGMERVMKGGDRARLRTLGGLLEVLNPAQGVGFLGALTVVLLRTRDQGLKRLNDDARA